MLRFVLWRLLLFVPTLLLITVLTFALSEAVPDNIIESNLESVQQNNLQGYQRYHTEYRRLAKLLGQDQPMFYWSLYSANVPDTLYKIIPNMRKRHVQQLLAHCADWEKIQRYDQLREQFLLQLLQQPANAAVDAIEERTRFLVGKTSPDQLAIQMDSIRATIQRDSFAQSHLMDDFTALNKAVNDIKEHKGGAWRRYLPKLTWRGKACRYHTWISSVVKGEFGYSLYTGQPVGEVVVKAVKQTLSINIWAILLSFLLAIPLGVYAAARAGTSFDKGTEFVMLLLYALPSFWVATLLQNFLASPDWLTIFPGTGVAEPSPDLPWWKTMLKEAHHKFLPVFCLTYGSIAIIARQTRNSVLKALNSDFVRTARAKGLSERQVLWRHALPNGLFPIITLVGAVIPFAIMGSIIIEFIFNIRGVGRVTLESLAGNNWPVVFGLLLLTASVTLISLLITDLLYAWADPRVRLQRTNQTMGL